VRLIASLAWQRGRGAGHDGLKLGPVLDGQTSSFFMPAVAGPPSPLRMRWWPPTQSRARLADVEFAHPAAAGAPSSLPLQASSNTPSAEEQLRCP